MKFTSSFIRGFIASTAFIILLGVCLVGIGKRTSTDMTDTQSIIPTMAESTCLTTVFTTTTTTTTESTTTTTTSTTAATTSRTGTTVVTTSQTIAAVTNSIEIEEETPTETESVFESTWIESEPTWTNENDIVLLAKLINHEASNSYEGKVMVGSCVVNRMNIKGFSVSDVIFEQGQFTTAYSLSTYTDLDYQAAQQVLSYGSSDTRIYYFDGCHPDGLNWFYDINRNYLGAW